MDRNRQGISALFALVALILCAVTACASVHENEVLASFSDKIPTDEAVDEYASPSSKHEKSLGIEGTKVPTVRVGYSSKRSSRKKRKSRSFAGIPDYFHEGHNITRLSQMLYRVVEQYKIRSMVDVPCRGHMRWMGLFLESMREKDGDPFVYYCIDSSVKILQLAESRMPVLPHVVPSFIQRKFWKLPLPKADLLFSWEGLEKMRNENVESMLRIVTQGGRHKYLLLASSPAVKNSKRKALNIRRAPYSYNLPKRMYKELAVDPSEEHPEKQMYLYLTAEMKKAT